jgi:hypothetical protein
MGALPSSPGLGVIGCPLSHVHALASSWTGAQRVAPGKRGGSDLDALVLPATPRQGISIVRLPLSAGPRMAIVQAARVVVGVVVTMLRLSSATKSLLVTDDIPTMPSMFLGPVVASAGRSVAEGSCPAGEA